MTNKSGGDEDGHHHSTEDATHGKRSANDSRIMEGTDRSITAGSVNPDHGCEIEIDVVGDNVTGPEKANVECQSPVTKGEQKLSPRVIETPEIGRPEHEPGKDITIPTFMDDRTTASNEQEVSDISRSVFGSPPTAFPSFLQQHGSQFTQQESSTIDPSQQPGQVWRSTSSVDESHSSTMSNQRRRIDDRSDDSSSSFAPAPSTAPPRDLLEAICKGQRKLAEANMPIWPERRRKKRQKKEKGSERKPRTLTQMARDATNVKELADSTDTPQLAERLSKSHGWFFCT